MNEQDLDDLLKIYDAVQCLEKTFASIGVYLSPKNTKISDVFKIEDVIKRNSVLYEPDEDCDNSVFWSTLSFFEYSGWSTIR